MTDLLFIHGWPLSSATWNKVAQRLPDHRCHLLDLPGSPPSSWTQDSDLSAEGIARWVREWASKEKLERYALVSFDTGAFIARLVAAEDERVSALIMSNTEVANYRPPWVPFYQFAMGLPGASAVFAALLASRHFLRSSAGFGNCYLDRGRIDETFRSTFIEPLRTRRGFQGAATFLRSFDYSAVDRTDALHARIRAPVHLIWGEQDETFPVRLLDDFANSFPTLSSITRLPGKLLVHDERPAEYAAAVQRAVA